MKDYFKLSEEEREALHNNFLQEPDAFYEKAESDKNNLKIAGMGFFEVIEDEIGQGSLDHGR